MNSPKTDAQIILEALQIGLEAAQERATRYYDEMKGYRPKEHERLDEEVRTIERALTRMEQAGSGEAPEPVAWITPDEASQSIVPTCAVCGEPMMHYNTTWRSKGGWVHAETGRFKCDKPTFVEPR